MRFIIHPVSPLSCAALREVISSGIYEHHLGRLEALAQFSQLSSLALALFCQSTSCGFNVPLIDMTSRSCKLDVLQGCQESMIREVRE
jgi:hypothetical protein